MIGTARITTHTATTPDIPIEINNQPQTRTTCAYRYTYIRNPTNIV